MLLPLAGCYGPSIVRMVSTLLIGIVIFIVLIGFGLVILYVALAPPRCLIRWLLSENVLFFVDDIEAKIMALTIDDAPTEFLTPRILEVLAKHNAKATFFVIGSNATQYPALLSRIVAEVGEIYVSTYMVHFGVVSRESIQGHEVANHDWTDSRSASVPLDALRRRIIDTERILDGVRPAAAAAAVDSSITRYFRPGQGAYTVPMLALLKELGLRCVLGNIYAHDPRIRYAPWIDWFVCWRASPGSIVILHDGA